PTFTSSSASTPSTSSRPCVALPEAADLVLRAARAGDAAAIARVHRETWNTTYAGILPLDVIASLAGRKSESVWMRRLAGPAEALGGEEAAEKTERLGLHSFSEIAYAWHDLTALVSPGEPGMKRLDEPFG